MIRINKKNNNLNKNGRLKVIIIKTKGIRIAISISKINKINLIIKK